MKSTETDRYAELRELFGRVFDERWSRDELSNFDELRDKFIFHMTDAIDDVAGLAELYSSCRDCDSQQASDRLYAFFLHAVPHLTAAGQIFDFIPQTFAEQKGVHANR